MYEAAMTDVITIIHRSSLLAAPLFKTNPVMEAKGKLAIQYKKGGATNTSPKSGVTNPKKTITENHIASKFLNELRNAKIEATNSGQLVKSKKPNPENACSKPL
jgi:hypothetical protein